MRRHRNRSRPKPKVDPSPLGRSKTGYCEKHRCKYSPSTGCVACAAEKYWAANAKAARMLARSIGYMGKV